MLHSHFLQARGVLLAFKGGGHRKKYGLKRGGRPKKYLDSFIAGRSTQIIAFKFCIYTIYFNVNTLTDGPK